MVTEARHPRRRQARRTTRPKRAWHRRGAGQAHARPGAALADPTARATRAARASGTATGAGTTATGCRRFRRRPRAASHRSRAGRGSSRAAATPTWQRTVGARVFDPLWLLARQWQTAEFQGEDTGIAGDGTRSRHQCRADALPPRRDLPPTRRQARRATTRKALPLEVLVERQRVRPVSAEGSSAKLTLAVEAGLHFLRMLQAQPMSKNYRAAFIAVYPLALPATAAELDGASAAYLESMAQRVPDARRLAAALRGATAPDPALGVATRDRAEVMLTAGRWLA